MDPAVVVPRILGTRHGQDVADRVVMPTLCIVGDRDPLFPPAAVRAAADMLPDACITEIAGSGHSPYFEDPAVWNALVDGFFRSLDR